MAENNTQRKKILIVEDEKHISQILAFNLMQAGYDYDTAFDGEEGLRKATDGTFDLILLDLMLPKMDGFEVCRRVRARSAVPIIIVTAREEEIDKVLGLDIGADDYVTKPFSMKVLLARIKANIRRSTGEMVTRETKEAAGSIITIRGLCIDNDTYTVTSDGVPAMLTKKEHELLVFLARNPNHVFSREELLEQVWGYEGFYGDVRTVDVTISRLRDKLEKDTAHPEYLFTKRGAGYYLRS